ncbi:18535_t:CDS:2, partial [Funneliformis geosporum]
ELLYCREHAFPLVPEEIVINLFHKAGGVPRYVLRNVEMPIRDVVGNKEEILDTEEKEKIEEQAYSRIELAISKTNNFDKIIKCFTEDEKRKTRRDKIRLMRNPYEASTRGFYLSVISWVRKKFIRSLKVFWRKQNFGAVDLFVTPNYIFQVTVSEYHPIKQVELKKVITNMPVYISDQNAKIQLYFVVPDDIYDKFKYQSYTTRDNDSNKDRPVLRMNSAIKNVEQWALKVQINLILEE